MKKLRLVVLFLTVFSFVLTSNETPLAIPLDDTTIQEQQEFEQMQLEVQRLQDAVQATDAELTNLQLTINNYQQQLDSLNQSISSLEKELTTLGDKAKEQQETMNTRLRTYYKSGMNPLTYFLCSFFFDSSSSLDSLVTLFKHDATTLEDLKLTQNKQQFILKSIASNKDAISELKIIYDEAKTSIEAKKIQQENDVKVAIQKQNEFETKYLAQSELAIVTPLSKKVDNNETPLDELLSIKDTLDSLLNSQLKSSPAKIEVQRTQEKLNQQIQNKRIQLASSSSTSVTIPVDSSKASVVIRYAQQFLGVPYLWGGTTPSGFDCSGLVQYCYSNALGIQLPRVTQDQINCGVHVPRDQLQPGDLIFPHIGHVQIYIGDGNVLHAPQTGDVVKVSRIGNVLEARRVIP